MWKNIIVEEVRKVREKHAAKFDYNFDAICRDLKQKESQSKREIVSLPPKRLRKAAA